MKSLREAKIQDLEHYVTPHLEHDKPDSNMSYNNLDMDASILSENLKNIGNKFIVYGVEEMAISSIFVKKC